MSRDEEGPPGAEVRGADARGATAGRAPPPAGAETEAGSWFLLLATVALLVARLPSIPVRVFDNDELEHAHAAWSVFRGLIPYKDFFEHHTPWYYFVLAPFFRWFPVASSFDAARHFLIFGRLLSLAMTALSVVLVVLVGRISASRRVGLLAGLLLVAQQALIQKTLEIRPDVPALVFFIGALWFLGHGLRRPESDPHRRRRWFLGGGLCLGAAIMCTQKMLFVLPGALAGLALWIGAGGRGAALARTSAVVALLGGVAIPALVTWLWFALHGAGGPFVYNNFLLNSRWQLRTGRHQMVLRSWPMLLLALFGAWWALFRPHRSGPRDPFDFLQLGIAAGLVAGAFVVPAAYEQYYLPPLAIACLFAARGLVILLDRSRPRARPWLLVLAVAPLLLRPVIDLGRLLGARNDVQLARLRFVFAHTRPTDPVLDGWLGTGVFRPAANYYFFMHSELWASLDADERRAYLNGIMSGGVRPALIAFDDELRALGPRLLQFVRLNYASRDGLFYLPVAPASPTADPSPPLR